MSGQRGGEPVVGAEHGADGRARRPVLAPDRFAARLSDVSLDDLAQRGIRGLIVDLDNTLVGFARTDLEREHLTWVQEAHRRGFRIVMLSNNFSQRVGRIAAQLGVAWVPNALKPLPVGFLRAARTLGLRRKQIAVVGDQLFTDVLGAKACGFYAILTEPIERADFPITKFFRFFERLLLGSRRA
jgi:HAD superfamily phosphatase (TIGR01668 family)